MQTPDVRLVNINELKPYTSNARTHSKKQVGQIARSLKEFGFVNPILADDGGIVIAGHGRLAAAKLLGMTTVPVVCITHMTPEQLRLYRIADNKLAELAGWDEDILKVEFQNLMEFDLDLTITGFEIPEIDKFLLNEDAPEDDDTGDLGELLKQEPVSRAGDLWLLGNHRLLCGDALDSSVYERLMSGGAAQAVFTDPPYNVPVEGHITGNGKNHHAEFAMAAGEMTRDEFIAFLTTALGHMATFSSDGSIHFVCMDWRHIEELAAAGRAVYSELKNICAWVKDNGGMGSLYRSQHEFIAVFKKGSAPHINNVQLGKYGRYRTNVWNYPGQNTFHAGREEYLAAHPTVKPVQLVADAILDCSSPGGLVLDPFGGSGTTLLAAEKTGRHARLIELEPRYVDVSIRRWQKLTGKQAIHAETGEAFSDTKQEVSHDGE